jgi:hypothetical protein
MAAAAIAVRAVILDVSELVGFLIFVAFEKW